MYTALSTLHSMAFGVPSGGASVLATQSSGRIDSSTFEPSETPAVLQNSVTSPTFTAVCASPTPAATTSPSRKFEMPTKPATNWLAGFW